MYSLIFAQCGAAIFQKWPRSSIFRLPALAHPDVRNWMTHRYPSELAVLQAYAGSPIDLEHIQNTHLRVALEEMRSLLAAQNLELKKVTRLLERRTAVFSPAQGFTASNYHTHGKPLSQSLLWCSSFIPALVVSEASTADEMAGPSTTTTFPSPRAPHTPQTSMTPQALFVEPPVASYYAEGGCLVQFSFVSMLMVVKVLPRVFFLPSLDRSLFVGQIYSD